jgi:hypothetical protein
VEDALHEARGCFIACQWKIVVYSLFEIAEKTQVKALKYMCRMRRESYDQHAMICQDLEKQGRRT